MNVDIQDFLDRCGLEEKLYPGKRFIKKLPKAGEHRSHCVEYDWRDPGVLHIEVKAGLSGHTLAAKDLKKYPVSFQSRTYVDFAISAGALENHEDEDKDGESDKGKSGGGGKAPRKRIHAFTDMMRGHIPDLAAVKKMVVMGKDIGHGAVQAMLESLAAQIRNLSIAPVNLLAEVSKVTRVAPGGFGHIPPAKGQVAYKPFDWAAPQT